jgi:imidazoleglycerol phosphate dehydratase HisB
MFESNRDYCAFALGVRVAKIEPFELMTTESVFQVFSEEISMAIFHYILQNVIIFLGM